MPFSTLNAVKEHMGKTFCYDDDENKWDDCNVPCGSEGSIQFVFYESPDMSSIAAYTVAVWGDLRDFGSKEDIETVKKWFNSVTKGEGVMVRNAILEIDIDGKDHTILRHED